MDKKQLTIDEAPEELDFFASALARGRPVKFNIEGQNVKLTIVGVNAEDGSRRSWMFHGTVEESEHPELPAKTDVKGWFHFRDRKGWLEKFGDN